MYLTAQHVVAADGHDGINVFLYTHGRAAVDSEERRIDWTHPDVAFIAEQAPGTLALQLIELEPRQNDVLSYLDAVARDGVPPSDLAADVELAVREIPASMERLPIVWLAGRTTLRFYCGPRIENGGAELRALTQRALSLLGAAPRQEVPAMPPAPAPAPLVAVATSDEYGTRYALDASSRARLQSLRPASRLPASVGAAHDVLEDLGKLVGSDVFSECAIALTGLSIEQINGLFGLQFKSESGQILWNSRERA